MERREHGASRRAVRVKSDLTMFFSDFDLVFLLSVLRLLVTASVAPSSPILVNLIKEALSSSETSVLTRATRRNISEDAILRFNKFTFHRWTSRDL
jgi:hypothetical protein